MVTVVLACGHQMTAADDAETAPICACGERRIGRVFAPPPRIRGVASGPHVKTELLDPIVVNLAPKGPLPMPNPTPKG